eukprot:CAMPEP_0198227790 /NCGR_PEP_ID=MMETSP1445-20131203/110643_1 /TAXON_ID=36898 /ORGANISM="Pyramimonas sp., Strain CCMP2087" /LENGTH=199 /DNA_ID=CAMNT_0043907961 /DNA_START=245 /DNA_END=841 /DNA_ORIENTATION=-
MLSVWKRLQAESIEFNIYKAMNANDSGFALQKNKWIRELRRMESLSRFCYRYLVFTVIAFASVVIACAFWGTMWPLPRALAWTVPTVTFLLVQLAPPANDMLDMLDPLQAMVTQHSWARRQLVRQRDQKWRDDMEISMLASLHKGNHHCKWMADSYDSDGKAMNSKKLWTNHLFSSAVKDALKEMGASASRERVLLLDG